MKELRIILGYLLMIYKLTVEDKYLKMYGLPSKADVGGRTVCKPDPEIPLIIEHMQY